MLATARERSASHGITADNAREQRVQELGEQLLAAARERKSSFWARGHWEEGLLRKLMESERFRIQALRFVDVLPALDDDHRLVQHLQDYFGDDELPLPGVARWGLEHAAGNVSAAVIAAAVRSAMRGLAGRFIGGSNTREALRTVERLRREGMAFTLDLLGEATVSEAEAADYSRRYLELLEAFAPRVRRWRTNPLLDRIAGRPSPRLNLSVKLSSLSSQLTAVSPAASAEAVKQRLRPILRSAREHGAFICLDMEQYDQKEIVLQVFRDMLVEPEFHDWPDVGLAMQAYLRDAESDVRDMAAWAKSRGTPVTVRLVRGAYWDYETVVAQQHGWRAPVWTEKWETDRSYERCLSALMESHPHLETAAATHNVRSLALALTLAEEQGLQRDEFELQMLYGMADPLKDAIEAMGHRVRVYVPFGELIPGMAYLVRRLLENTASQSFLRLGFAEDLPAKTLLAPPAGREGTSQLNGPRLARSAQESTPYRNEPVRRFTDAAERHRFTAAIERVRGELGREYPLVIGGEERTTGSWIESTNPARPFETVGRVASAGILDAQQAMAAATAAFPVWREYSAERRADLLLRTAQGVRERRDEFAAWEIVEAGKTWREADADVTESIDYLEYYAREMIRFSQVQSMNVPGETNEYFYEPRGVAIVIPPWNFPLAILTGMLSASVVTGNTAIVKPASQTPVIAAKLIEIMRTAGIPEGVVNFLPGPGGEIGEYLVRDPLSSTVGSEAWNSRDLKSRPH